MKDILVIGVSGHLGSGKDYLTEHYIRPHFENIGRKVAIVAFADAIKVEAAAKNRVPLKTMYNDKTPEIRRMLQKVGTEMGRNIHGPHIWIDTLKNWMEVRNMRDDVNTFIITDCRFKNEKEWIENLSAGWHGAVIRVVAPDRNYERLGQESQGIPELFAAIAYHPSEIDLDDVVFKHVVDNSRSCANVVSDQLKDILDQINA